MPTASTSKGEQRRRHLVDAAVQLMLEGGIGAIRHRAVAERAGVPLSATTYYFSSIDELVASAVQQCSLHEHERMQGLVDGITVRRRGTAATADLLVDIFVAPGGSVDRRALIARGERLAASARSEALRELQHRLAGPYSFMLAEVLRKCRRRAGETAITNITALVSGIIMVGLLDASADLRTLVRDALLPVLDTFAPPLDGAGCPPGGDGRAAQAGDGRAAPGGDVRGAPHDPA